MEQPAKPTQVEQMQMAVFLAGGDRVQPLTGFGPTHPAVMRQREEFWERYGSYLARAAYVDALMEREGW